MTCSSTRGVYEVFTRQWCLKNWEGFKLTKYEHWDYLQGWKRKLSQDPNNEELALKVKRQELLYSLRR